MTIVNLPKALIEIISSTERLVLILLGILLNGVNGR